MFEIKNNKPSTVVEAWRRNVRKTPTDTNQEESAARTEETSAARDTAAISRRTWLIGAALAVGAGGLVLPKRSIAQQKAKQQEVQYQDTPKDGQKCSGCALFQPPNACQTVEGTISPEGWCAQFAPKA